MSRPRLLTQVWDSIRRWLRIPAPRSPLWPEYSYASFMLAFGVSLMLPTDAFTLSVNYVVLSRIAPEHVWGWFFIVYGALWLLAVATHNLRLRRAAAAPGALVITWLSVSVLLSNPLSTTALPFGSVALAASYCAARLVVPWTQP